MVGGVQARLCAGSITYRSPVWPDAQFTASGFAPHSTRQPVSKSGNKRRHRPAPHTISDDDAAIFRNAVGPVETLPGASRRKREQVMPSTRPLMLEADEAQVVAELLDDTPPDPDVETGDDLVHRQDGIQHGVIRRLRRGHYKCQAEIDLHGMVVDVARHCLGVFLHEALENGYSCVRVVHGKGLRSGHRGPVLKNKVAGWLARRREVLAYVSARPVDGGTGALYVLLKRPKTGP